MKTFEDFNTIDEKEELFLELAHLDELEIRFDLIEHEDYIFYSYMNVDIFLNNKKLKYFYIDSKIWNIFTSKYNPNLLQYYENEISLFMNIMINKYFKLYGYNPKRF